MEAQGQTEDTPSTDNAPASDPLTAGKAPARRGSREEKGRKKDDKGVEYVLRALSTLGSPEEKLAAMCKKYAEAVDDNRKLQLTAKQAEKRMGVLQREKEQLQTEHSKAVLTRSRLESLCRELQRQNKAVKDESLLKIREEEEKRKEVSGKFQSTLAEITALMQQNNEKNSKLREDNLEMTKKFKSLYEQYEMREQQVEKMSRQMQLESQLADAKLAKAQLEIAAEKETLLREKQQLMMELQKYQAECQELRATEASLRSQVGLYTGKFDEFQDALTRSSEVFGGFKDEMDKMSRKVDKMQKEALMWKGRCEKSQLALLEMAADKQRQDAELAQTARKLLQLQKLCRTLQAERTALHSQLRAFELKGQPAGEAGSLTSELQSVCDRLTESLGGLQLAPGSTLDQAECPSKARAKARQAAGEADPAPPRAGSCGCAADKSKSSSKRAAQERVDCVGNPTVGASGKETHDETAEPEVHTDVPETTGSASAPSFGVRGTAASPDENIVASSPTVPRLDRSSSALAPGEGEELAEGALPAVGLQPLPCGQETGGPPDSAALNLPRLPVAPDVSCRAADVSDEILFKPIANGHAILLPEENLPLEVSPENEVKKKKDAGKKGKK
ncbi:alpha-taxilin-like isoform X1 [Bacillus rossius redtenbacheri]|uniref:alpha-taxilin-like isoform X1 n=1 Tax=Bacillus rossius redtenbacheri TaxID=93214 RepID=UPI002FDEDEF6